MTLMGYKKKLALKDYDRDNRIRASVNDSYLNNANSEVANSFNHFAARYSNTC